MKGLKKCISAVTAAALILTALPIQEIGMTANAAGEAASKPIWLNVEKTVRLVPKDASIFNDTDGNGFGEFEGWGTSLCWWANRLGYSEKMTEDAAEKFFGDTGLDMNIGRYNVGGGDNPDTTAHRAHIVRSDSAVPGYCVDVTKVEAGKTAADYASYDRVDMECGYAWNYNWNADKNQMNILKAAAAKSGTEFIPEAFSNSPPYFMTVSGCSSGNTTSSKDNLRADSYNAFAAYMADVIVHWAKEGVINFQSVSPMNEPDTDYWGANSNKQEGCHFDGGESQSKILVALASELEKQKEEQTDTKVKEVLERIIISASDETDIDKAIANYGKLSDEAKAVVKRIDTHTYSGSNRKGLRETAKEAGMNLWMSEVDGAYTAGAGAGEMTAALGLAQRIMLDLNGLKSTTWILWNAVDSHVDAEEKANWPNSNNDFASMEDLYKKVDVNKGYWGIAFGDHNKEEVVLTKKYYGYGQFTRYIRPGDCIIGSTDKDGNTLVAYNPDEKRAVLVVTNTAADDAVWKFDFSSFTGMGNKDKIQAIRSSGSLANGENWADVTEKANITVDTANKNFVATLKANSITTFIINDVTYDKAQDDYENQNTSLDELTEIPLNADMVTGSEPWTNSEGSNGGNTIDKVVDGDYGTFFDGVEKGWVQIDLGKIHRIDAVGYAPRKSYANRCNGTFYGSNDGQNWTALYKIAETPSEGKITGNAVNEWLTDSNYYRYIKYTVPDDGSSCCNMAEIKLYGKEAVLSECIADYKNKADSHEFEGGKASFETVVNNVKPDASGDDAVNEMASVVAAYDALVVKVVTEEWNYEYNTISGTKGAPLYDTEGKLVQAHGGQVQKITYDYDYNDNGTIDADEHEFWFWVGEDKTNDYRPCPGVRAYISKDLYNWKDVGNILKTVSDWNTFTTEEYFTDLYGDLTEEQKFVVYKDIWTANSNAGYGCVIERPKMLYNDKTGKYVIWFHADGQVPTATNDDGTNTSGSNYGKARAGVAVSDSPLGPFKMQGSYLLNGDPDADHGFDKSNQGTGHVRDMNLFKDDDGTAYVIYSSDGNQTLHIAKLNDEYTNVVQPDNSKAVEGVDYTRNFINESREAPAMFKYSGKYYMITSGCTGWGPNQASYAVANHPMGPWTTVGDPCTESDAGTTYFTQSTCVIPVDAANGKYIYMGDRWYNPEVSVGPGKGGSLRNSRYVWIPIEFKPGNEIEMKHYANWKLTDDVFKRNADKTELTQSVAKAAVLEQEQYMPDSWEAFDKIYQEIMLIQTNNDADQNTVNDAKNKLEQALKALKTVRSYLQEEIEANSVPEANKGAYEADSWAVYQTMLTEAKNLLNEPVLDIEREEEVQDAIKALKDAKSALELIRNNEVVVQAQEITVTDSYEKVYGDKDFKLDVVQKTGNGALSYQTSDKSVADVNTSGMVSIKGYGTCTITVTAGATENFKSASATVTITVEPKKAVISKVTPVKGKKLTVQWKKDASVTGYEVQCALKKDFKKVASKATIKKAKTTKVTLKKLKKGKKYYVRVRAYKTVKGRKYIGAWSSMKLSKKIK